MFHTIQWNRDCHTCPSIHAHVAPNSRQTHLHLDSLLMGCYNTLADLFSSRITGSSALAITAWRTASLDVNELTSQSSSSSCLVMLTGQTSATCLVTVATIGTVNLLISLLIITTPVKSPISVATNSTMMRVFSPADAPTPCKQWTCFQQVPKYLWDNLILPLFSLIIKIDIFIIKQIFWMTEPIHHRPKKMHWLWGFLLNLS